MNDISKDNELYPINGYEGVYSITRTGKIWSHKRPIVKSRNGGKPFSVEMGGVWMKNHKSTHYLQVILTKDGIRKMPVVHKLIAETFIPNPEMLPQVNHIDGNKTNNAIDNLEWVTHSGNQLHAWATGLQKNTPLRIRRGKILSKQYCHKDSPLYYGRMNHE